MPVLDLSNTYLIKGKALNQNFNQNLNFTSYAQRQALNKLGIIF